MASHRRQALKKGECKNADKTTNRNNTYDNRICNLKWKPRDKHRIDHLSIPIEMVTIDYEHEDYFDSAADASGKTGILRTAIYNNLKGRSKTVRTKDGKKHRFRYINKEPDRQNPSGSMLNKEKCVVLINRCC